MSEGNPSGCNCTFAEELKDNGLLTCEDAKLCPWNCAICSNCMFLLGCDVTPMLPLVSRWTSISKLHYIIGGALVGVIVIGLLAYYLRRKWQNDHDLNQNLIERQKHGMADEQKGPSFMYIHEGNLTWKPLQSVTQYVAEEIQPVSTMSTVSTGKYSEYTQRKPSQRQTRKR